MPLHTVGWKYDNDITTKKITNSVLKYIRCMRDGASKNIEKRIKIFNCFVPKPSNSFGSKVVKIKNVISSWRTHLVQVKPLLYLNFC